MNKVLLVSLSLALVSGCASYYAERPTADTETGGVLLEPAGAATDPNPNWDVNARDFHQHPFRAGFRLPWTSYGNAVQTSTDSEKNMGYHVRPQDDLP